LGYLEILETYCLENCILKKAKTWKPNWIKAISPTHTELINTLDDLQIQCIIHAKRHYQKLHATPYRWTLELPYLLTEIQYQRYVLWQVKGQ